VESFNAQTVTVSHLTEIPASQHAGWVGYRLFCGGEARADAALAELVAPTVRAAAPDAWAFTREHDRRGAHLRLRLHRAEGFGPEDRERVEALLVARLRDLAAAPAREVGGLYPREPGPAPEPAPVQVLRDRRSAEAAGPLAEARRRLATGGSELAVASVPELGDGRDRAALGLAALRAVAAAHVAPVAHEAFWRRRMRRTAGQGERAERLLERLEVAAERLGEDLRGRADALGETGPLHAALEAFDVANWAGGRCAPDDPAALADLAAWHAGATRARLGLTAVEEVVLAAVLARGAAARPARPPARRGVAPATAPALEVVGVSKRDRSASVVEEASFAVRHGEVFGLLGPDGAGKRTLLHLAAGLRSPSGGAVRVLGIDPAADPGAAAGHVQLVASDDAAAPARSTVRETLALLQAGREPPLDALLAATRLLDEAGTPVGELDPGRRRLLAIAEALVADPEVLALDEPTRGLDPGAREEIWDVLRGQAAAGRAVVVATTAAQEALSLCDRVAMVAGGAVVAVDAPEAIVETCFAERELVLLTAEEPDPALLDALPEVLASSVAEHEGGFAVSVRTLQPEALVALLEHDPAFPEFAVESEDR
jgi:ABC-2 type transport system ATP-binding protein